MQRDDPKEKSLKDGAAPDVEEPGDALPEIRLEDLPEALQAAARRAGWASLMPVQAKAIPYLLAGRDLMVQSRTGSGKTGAFLLPILEKVDPRQATCQALVLVPTRELAHQVIRDALTLSEGMEVNIVSVYGGAAYGPQLEGLRRGAHLVVGTPGRILDHLMRGSLQLDRLAILVFDEADRMLSMGFYPDMMQLRSYLPRRRSGFMFSATFPARVRRLAGQFLHQPQFLSLSRDRVHVTDTTHVYYEVPAMEKDRCLVRIIEVVNPDSAIVFCNTRAQVDYVCQVLQRFGYDADQLSADLSQPAREKVLGRLYRRRLRFLVATDLAGRGIDVADLSHVFLYDLPEDPDTYVHRTGRTGRAGATGVAISLVDIRELLGLKQIAKKFNIDLLQRPLPSDEDVERIVAERVTALLEAKLRSRDRLRVERMQRMLPLARELGESDDELAIIAMLLDDYYQETLHAPADAAEDEARPAQAKQAPASRKSPRRSRRRPPEGKSRKQPSS